MTRRSVQILNEIAAPGQGSLPESLVHRCSRSLGDVAVALSLADQEGLDGTLSATTADARALQDLQFSLGEGPSFDAALRRVPVLASYLQQRFRYRWPTFLPHAQSCGFGGIFVLPLRVGAIGLGVLSIFRQQEAELDQRDLAEAFAFAGAATTVLTYLEETSSDERESLIFAAALREHAVVHQATGMISVQLEAPLIEALARLRAYAFSSGHNVNAVSAAVIERRLRFDSSEAGATGRVEP